MSILCCGCWLIREDVLPWRVMLCVLANHRSAWKKPKCIEWMEWDPAPGGQKPPPFCSLLFTQTALSPPNAGVAVEPYSTSYSFLKIFLIFHEIHHADHTLFHFLVGGVGAGVEDTFGQVLDETDSLGDANLLLLRQLVSQTTLTWVGMVHWQWLGTLLVGPLKNRGPTSSASMDQPPPMSTISTITGAWGCDEANETVRNMKLKHLFCLSSS